MNTSQKLKRAYAYWARHHDEDAKHNPAIMSIGTSLIRPIKSESVVLDFGCGTGRNIPKLLMKGCTVVCMDISEEMLERAKSRYGEKADFILFKGGKWPFKKNTFNAVHACLVVDHIKKLNTFYSEASRVLKRGGILVFDDIIKGAINIEKPFVPRYHEYRHEPRYITRWWGEITHSHTLEEHKKLCAKYGFSIIHYRATKINKKMAASITAKSYEKNKGRNFMSIFLLKRNNP